MSWTLVTVGFGLSSVVDQKGGCASGPLPVRSQTHGLDVIVDEQRPTSWGPPAALQHMIAVESVASFCTFPGHVSLASF